MHKATIITFMMILFCTYAQASEFRAIQCGGEDWKISTLSEEIARSESFNIESKLGYISFVYIVRESGVWDNEFLYMGPIAQMSIMVRQFIGTKIKKIMDKLDEIIPDEKIIVICFIVEYDAVDIMFGPERWKNKQFHVKVAKGLNE